MGIIAGIDNSKHLEEFQANCDKMEEELRIQFREYKREKLQLIRPIKKFFSLKPLTFCWEIQQIERMIAWLAKYSNLTNGQLGMLENWRKFHNIR